MPDQKMSLGDRLDPEMLSVVAAPGASVYGVAGLVVDTGVGWS